MFREKNFVAQGIEPGISGSVARNSDQQSTEAVQKDRSRFEFGYNLGRTPAIPRFYMVIPSRSGKMP
jgi:hypothetical protein